MEYEDLPPDTADPIRRSWQRCMQLGLATGQRLSDVSAPRATLAERLEANARLVAYAQPVIENLYQQIERSSSMVLLADAQGMILRSVGDADFVARAARVSLAPGAVWSEDRMGTNAIGTALQEQRAVAVFGDQHYLCDNRFLTCLSTVILGPSGGVLGILDISSDARVTHTHAQALLQSTAEIIENRLIETVAAGAVAMRFHPAAEALGTPLEGLIVFDESGTVLACNRRARRFLQREGAEQEDVRGWFATAWSALVEHAVRRRNQPLALQAANGRTVMATVSLLADIRPGKPAEPAPAQAAPAAAPTEDKPRTTLQALDLGDARMAEAVRRAQCIAERGIPLLIQGETGTGKEVFAQAFHHSSLRRNGPFVAVNCAAIPGNLIEAELFGYVDGAYTGARREGARGKLRQAHGGTLFLDEIGDMPHGLQAVLLRVLETRRVTPLGGGAEEAVDIALVCASHQPLRELMGRGAFRADLFFRLSGMTVALPPLRERSDFTTLVRQILGEEAPRHDIRISREALAILHRHSWPGNLRQLRNALRLAVALLGDQHCLTREHLPQEILEEAAPPRTADGSSQSLRAVEVKLVRDAVARHGGNISAAARELGITRTTLYRKLRQLDGS